MCGLKTYDLNTSMSPVNRDISVYSQEAGVALAPRLEITFGYQPGPWPFKPADYNQDGVVDVVDLGILAQNYDTGLAVPLPEPTTMSLLGLSLAMLLRRRGA